MKELYLDVETYSSVDLKKSNAYRYAEAPDFDIMMCAWADGIDGDVRLALGHEEIARIPGLLDPSVTKVAHNAAFERICFSRLAGLPTGEYLPPEDYDDTQAIAAENGYPQKLEQLAEALGGEKKDAAGTHLISYFCKPNRKGERNRPEDSPEKWEEFKAYCVQDVVTLQDVARNLPGWPTEAERAAYLTDQHINDNGIYVDADMAELAVTAADDNRMVQELEITHLTGVLNPGSGPQMLKWLRASGLEVPNMQKATVETLLEGELGDRQRRVLELRQELALVAAKKYTAATDRINSDSRLRGSFHFFGAHTGRWAGRGVQLQNLPSATIEPDEGEDVDVAIAASVLDLQLGLPIDAHTLKALVRAMFYGPFTVVDYSAIEARVLAWLAGETWALEAFEEGRDIYVETAARMGSRYTRKEGKVATLALGYNGGVGSLRAMGATGSDSELKGLVYQWRDTNSEIVGLWDELGSAFRTGDRWAGDRVYVERDGKTRRLVLPSGRAVTYHGVGEKWVTNQWGSRVRQLSFRDPKRHPYRQDTYGGRITENITQAVARDVLSEALVRLREAGHKVVGHVHDEILVEAPASVDEVTEIMVTPPTWSAGLPLAAEGFYCPRYRKG